MCGNPEVAKFIDAMNAASEEVSVWFLNFSKRICLQRDRFFSNIQSLVSEAREILDCLIKKTRSETQKHLAYETDFWSTKMGLKDASTERLTATKSSYDAFMANADNLKNVREQLGAEGFVRRSNSFSFAVSLDSRAREGPRQVHSRR
jgi:hypothetical protein